MYEKNKLVFLFFSVLNNRLLIKRLLISLDLIGNKTLSNFASQVNVLCLHDAFINKTKILSKNI